MTDHTHNHSHCGCCGTRRSCEVSRRGFMAGMGAAAGTVTLSSLVAKTASAKEPVRQPLIRQPLVVQPVLVYSLPQRREGTSWRSWGAIQTERDVAAEKKNITQELAGMNQDADFPLKIKPLLAVRNPDEAKKVADGDHDVLLMYAASSWVNTLEALTNPEKWTLVFLRHKSGPVYLWYEIVSNRFLRKTVDEYTQPGVTPKDVVVDKYEEVLWRLRAFSGLKNTIGKRVVCVGGPAGWGVGGRPAPDNTRNVFGMELIDVSYDDLGKRIMKARANQSLVKWSNEQAEKFLREDGISLHTDKEFVKKCFLLTEVFHQLLHEYET
ncbi:sugar isomerase, partial [bacterium]|nr:sugar isomerase [bacterium]